MLRNLLREKIGGGEVSHEKVFLAVLIIFPHSWILRSFSTSWYSLQPLDILKTFLLELFLRQKQINSANRMKIRLNS